MQMAKEAEQGVKLKKMLKATFGHDDFMSPNQKKATEEVFRGEKDVYINLQPGAGKSICFQLPAVLRENSLTVVFVPSNCLGELGETHSNITEANMLVLMINAAYLTQDSLFLYKADVVQVDLLKRRNINAEYLGPATRPELQNKILQDMKADKLKLQFLYASTDKKIRDFVFDCMTELNNRKAVTFIVFDEAQCMSRFSNDYAPSYREAAESATRLIPSIRKIVLTGTAPYEVKNDILKTLGMENPRVILESSVFTKCLDVCFVDTLRDPFQHLRNFIIEDFDPADQQSASERKYGIIFCRKRQAVKKIERELRAMNVPVVSCHGGLSSKDRKSILGRWSSGEISVIAATPQFALGLHRPNVRFVVHWGLPMSMQQLYQDNGRAAKLESPEADPAWCRVYFSIEEEDGVMLHIKSLPRGSSEEAAISSRQHQLFSEFVEYCFGTECRIVAQTAYHGHKVAPCRWYCDVCRDLKNLKNRIDDFLCIRSRKKHLLAAQSPGKRTQGSNIHWAHVSFLRKTREVVFAAPKARERSYDSLLTALTQNYNEARAEIQERMGKDDLPEIARQLEYSVFMSASNSQKYGYDIVQTIRAIRKSKASRVACGYLRYYKTERKPLSYAKPEIITIDVDDDDERTGQSVEKMEVAILDDNSSGSETA